ncbi:MAG: AMP-binding protein [Burkholderiales bacterium]|nr:AMP-binding protein [Burkholderiales bacterium]
MEKIWLKNYKDGIPHEISLAHNSMGELFLEACGKYKHKKAVTCQGYSLTFGELEHKSKIFANELKKLGFVKGDRLGVMLPNSVLYPVVVFAALLMGVVVVNVNPLYTKDELEYIIQNSEPKAIVVLDVLADKTSDLKKLGVSHIIKANIADPYGFVKRFIISNVQKYVLRTIPAINHECLSFRDMYTQDVEMNSFEKVDVDCLAFIQYTGATTGRPKGAMLSHGNILSNIAQIFGVLEPQVPSLDSQIVICALPLYHIFSLTANLFTFCLHGSENVMIPNPKDIKSMVKVMNSTPFTVFNGLDTLYHKLLETPEFVNTPHPDYKYGISGGMATRPSVALAWFKATGTYPTNCYGLTETSPATNMSYFDDEYNGSVGLPIPSTHIEIRNQNDLTTCLDINENGVIFIKGPQVMSGYWRNEEQTKKALVDGWLNTGDVGNINDRGQLTITSRVSELIIVSGFNVYPAEVERVIDELPQVKDVAVLGRPSESTGECVYAFVSRKEGSTITEKEVYRYCKQHLTRYKLPKEIIFLDELPKTSVGKSDKKRIVAEYFK